MSDGQDWLPNPISKPAWPTRERLFVGVASFLSLLFGVIGLVLVGFTVQCIWLIVHGANKPLAVKLALLTGCLAAAFFAITASLRIVLNRDRKLHS